MWRVEVGDCRRVMADMPDGSVDSVVCDPPYELGFMGKSWDASGVAYDVGLWAEVLRLLKPGGHLLAFGGSRTYHRLACAVEDAGFEIRDQIMWVYGSGFPKSLNISKSIEGLLTTGSANKTAFKNLSGEQVDRGNWGIAKQQFTHGQRDTNYDETAGETRLGRLEPTTEEAKRWQGWGTALKPAHEPIVVARKPLVGTVAANVLEYGTGGLNIDGCRIPTADRFGGGANGSSGFVAGYGSGDGWRAGSDAGRWPANLIHDGSDEVLELFPDSSGGMYPAKRGQAVNTSFASGQETEGGMRKMGDSGSAARFFYCAKAGKKDRNEGAENRHPTVKPTELMRYLCRLVTPPNGTVLDPFCGSGSTGKAAVLEGFSFIGIEQDAEYADIAKARIRHTDERR